MILPIYLYGNPVLREVAQEIDPNYPQLKELIDNMFETMYQAEGVGLAAPQVGLPIRILVIDANPMAADFPECKGFKRAFINLHIEKSGDDVAEEEGCLSLPGISEKVYRKNKVVARYVDSEFVPHEEVFEGFAARVLQHEYDHLDGVLFIDHISAIRRQLNKSRLNSITKGTAKCSYRVKAVGK